MLEIAEIYTNDTEGYIFGDSDGYYATFTNNLGELFRSLQRQYGRARKMCVDSRDGQTFQVGWVFEKRMRYSDCNETYLQLTWVEVKGMRKPLRGMDDELTVEELFPEN